MPASWRSSERRPTWPAGEAVTIEATVVRHTVAGIDGLAHGIAIRDDQDGERASAIVESSLVEHNRGGGVVVHGSDATIEASVVRDTLPAHDDGSYGTGLSCGDAAMTMHGTAVRGNRVAAIFAWACTTDITACRLEDTIAGHFFSHDELGKPVDKYEDVADGLLATRGSTITAANSFVANCVRAGILSDDTGGPLARVISTNNRFDMSLQGDPWPTYDETCSFAGNSELSILTDGNLPVPDAPPEMPTPP